MPISSQSSEKKLPKPSKTGPQRKRASGPSYLYLKGNVFYFRYVFSEEHQRRFLKREFRMSLQTGMLRSARRSAITLRAYLEAILMENSDKTYAELRMELATKLQDILNSSVEKKTLSVEVIKQRMDNLRQAILNEGDRDFYQPPVGVIFDNGQPKYINSADSLNHQYQVFLKNVVNNKDFLKIEYHPEIILNLLHNNIFSIDEMTNDVIKIILNEYIKMQITLNKIYYSRENGDYAYERSFQIVKNLNFDQKVIQKEEKKLYLSQFINLYVETKINDNQWKKHTLPDRKGRLEFLIDILGDKEIKEISREDMRYFRDTLRKLPPNRKKSVKFRGKSIKDILKMSPEEVLNIKTVNTVVEAAASMFVWGIREGYLDVNPAKSLQIKDNRQDISLREAFSDDDIKLIFYSGFYTKDKFIHEAYYWIPLIGLYSGMRLEEICQLHCSDIKQDGKIWYFDVNTNSSDDGIDSKLVKTKSSIRLVPIHKELIKLGLIDYVKKINEKGYCRVFYELNKTDKSPKYGKQVTKTFSRFIQKIGVEGKKSFHSLRHSFSDFYKKRNLHNDIFRQVFGHEIVELAGRQYGSNFSVEQCYKDIISKLSYFH